MMSVRAFLCVAIRTKSLKKGVVIVSVGAGLVQVINDNDNRIAPKNVVIVTPTPSYQWQFTMTRLIKQHGSEIAQAQ